MSLASRGHWKEAASGLAMGLPHQPDNHDFYHALAPLLVQSGDIDGYRQLCVTIVSKFGATKDTYIADRMAKDCLILPVPGMDLARVGDLAQRALTQGANQPALPFFQVCKAMAEYRQGHFESAAEWAKKASGSPIPYSAAESFAVLSLAQWRMQQYEEARASIARCEAVVEKSLPKLESGNLGDDWRDWIITHVWLAEAKSLILGAPARTRAPGEK
jgi:hypothetical protein